MSVPVTVNVCGVLGFVSETVMVSPWCTVIFAGVNW